MGVRKRFRSAARARATALSSGVASIAGLALVLALACAAHAEGHRYYVDTSGSDRHSGTSPSRAWRSVGRVNRARLEPGDVVVFRAGRVFGDAALIPRSSGSPRARIRFGSFGGGRAILTRGVFLVSIAWITIDGLRIHGAAQGIASGGDGSGARYIDLLRNRISRVQIGVNAPNSGDRSWRIADNRIARTGDSGLILEGSDFTVERNRIARTGTDPRITYGKHGIYAKGARLTLLRNRIDGFVSEGISTRFRDAVIAGNVIEGGEGGIGYYAEDPQAGTTVIRRNRITRVGYGIYLAPTGAAGPSRERFQIVANTIFTRGGSAIDAPDSRGRVEVSDNHVRWLPPSAPAQGSDRTDVERSSGGGLAWFGAALAAVALAFAFVSLARTRSRS